MSSFLPIQSPPSCHPHFHFPAILTLSLLFHFITFYPFLSTFPILHRMKDPDTRSEERCKHSYIVNCFEWMFTVVPHLTTAAQAWVMDLWQLVSLCQIVSIFGASKFNSGIWIASFRVDGCVHCTSCPRCPGPTRGSTHRSKHLC